MRLGAALGEQGVNFLNGDQGARILENGVTPDMQLAVMNHPIDCHPRNAELSRSCTDGHVVALSPIHISIIPDNPYKLCKVDKLLATLYNLYRLNGLPKGFRA